MDKIIDYSLDNIGLIATLVILFIIFIVNTIISYKVYKSQHKYTKIFNLHADVIKELYSKLIRFSTAITNFTMRSHLVENDWKKEEQERLENLNSAYLALKDFFYPNRIFLPLSLCNRIENLMNEYINKAQDFENYKAEIRNFQNNFLVKRHIESSRKITTEIQEELPLIIEDIEYLFRKMLGISNR